MVLEEMTGESAPRTHGSGWSTKGISCELVVGLSTCAIVVVARIGRDAPSISASLDLAVSIALSRRNCAPSSHAELYTSPESNCANVVEPLPRCTTSAGSTVCTKVTRSGPVVGKSAGVSLSGGRLVTGAAGEAASIAPAEVLISVD